ncbi:MAG: hypothetical protein WBP08_00570, partial [Saprospiraceae bacterium]
NDGSETFVLGNYPATTNARIKVRYAPNSCFEIFDISDTNFTISGSCTLDPTLISSTSPISLPYADIGLNLGLTNNLGTVVSGFSGNISTSDTPGSLIFLDGNPATCAYGGNSTYFETIYFVVDISGTYKINHGGAFGTVINLYQSTFGGSNCSNFVQSNATRPLGSGPVNLTSSMTVSLTSNTLYFLMISGFSVSQPTHPFNYNITFPTKPVGANIYNGVILPANFHYTYVALNTSSNLISGFSDTSDFTSLSGGSYCVYGLSYPLTSNPNNFIGLSLNSLLGSGNCSIVSTNCKPVTITCSSIVSSSANSGSGTIRNAFECLPSGSVVSYTPGIQSTLTESLLINKSITFQGNNGTIINLNFSGLYGIKIAAGKTLTLKDIKINLIGTASPVILNEGTLILENAEIKGNVNPVINNLGAVNVVGNLPSVIKKL